METTYTFNDVNIMPKFSDIMSRKECKTDTTFCGENYEVPIIPANMSSIVGREMLTTMSYLGGIGIMHRFNGWKEEIKDLPSTVKYACSIGVNNVEEDLEFIMNNSSPVFLVIDVAHGYHANVGRALTYIKKTVPGLKVVAGNVATGDGARYLVNYGADAVKCGVGNGGLCETRIRTGVGVPQLTAILDVKNAIRSQASIIADGGVETPGDVAKAIAAGADMVMSGGFFAGTKETPLPLMKSGDWLAPTLYKQYMGSASFIAKQSNGSAITNIEGNSKLIPYKGTCTRIVEEVLNGLRSSMSYVGARTITEFQNQARLVLVTPNGTREARPYLLG